MDEREPGQSQSGWLFNDDDRAPLPVARRPRRRFNPRSLSFWMNIAFYVILAGVLFGAASEPWFTVVGIVWAGIGIFLISKSRRNQPRQPTLFEDEH